MPELPEVETIVRELRPLLVGRRISGVRMGRQTLRRRWDVSWESSLVGRRVHEICRRGKWIVIVLDKGLHLVIHLGMTGQLTTLPARQPLENHTHLVLDLDRGRHQLRFRDVRRFGSAAVFTGQALVEQFFEETRLGPEPFEVNAAYWRACLAGTRRCIKAVLLDQRVVAGVGNIYADESLYEARLHPARRGMDLTTADATRLRTAISVVLSRAIDLRGSSIRDYIGGSGAKGQYQKEFRVYGREGQPCVRCRTLIERIRLAGRSTYYCPRCQTAGVKQKNRRKVTSVVLRRTMK
jgi:formamidopyrimidine-DNA glycosylase